MLRFCADPVAFRTALIVRACSEKLCILEGVGVIDVAGILNCNNRKDYVAEVTIGSAE